MTEADLDLSVVIVGTNQRFLLTELIHSLPVAGVNTRYEVLLVDNASTDGTSQWAAAALPRARIVRNEQAAGFAANVNRGIAHARPGRYLLVLNPDIICLPGLFDHLVDFMDAHPDVGIAGPRLLNPDGTIQPSCRAFSTPLRLLLRGLRLDGCFRSSRLMRDYLMADFDHRRVADVDWVTGAALVVRRQALAEVGCMDEDRYYLYSDDQDWCCRMWQAGWRVCYVPGASAVHVHMREGIRKPWSRAARHQLRSALRMFRKFGWRLSRSPLTAVRRVASPPPAG